MESTNTPNYILIGDIHSQHHKLNNLLTELRSPTNHYIFLGDINDSVLPNSSFLKTLNIVLPLVESGNATLIRSNHQRNLHRILRGQRTKASLPMTHTLQELKESGYIEGTFLNGKVELTYVSAEMLELANWLDSRPYIFEAEDFIAVHAYYSRSNERSSRKWKDKCLYGKVERDPETNLPCRIEWWKDYPKHENDPYIVAGHYHEVFVNEDCAILDGGCGSEEAGIPGQLVAMDWKSKTLHYF